MQWLQFRHFALLNVEQRLSLKMDYLHSNTDHLRDSAHCYNKVLVILQF